MSSTGFGIPTLATIKTRVEGDVAANLGDAYIPGSGEWAYARILAGVSYPLYQYQDRAAVELLPVTATEAWLARHAIQWAVSRLPAVAAKVTITATWTAGVGAIPAGTLLTGADGQEYTTDAIMADPGGPYPDTQTGVVTASEAGDAGNRGVGALLTWATALPGIAATVTVTALGTTGTDQEALEDWRTRILDRIRAVAQGGCLEDWRQWTLESDAGVAQAWPINMGAGDVQVIYRGTTAQPTVQAYLEDDSRRPITMDVLAVKATDSAKAMSIELHILAGYVLADVRTAIIAAVNALYTAEGEPSGTIRNSRIRDAISDTPGVDWFILSSINGDGTGLSNITSGATTLPVVGVVTWS